MAVLPEEKLQMVKKLDIELDQQMQDHMSSFVKKPNGADLDYLVKLVTVDMYCDEYIEDHDPDYAKTLNPNKAKQQNGTDQNGQNQYQPYNQQSAGYQSYNQQNNRYQQSYDMDTNPIQNTVQPGQPQNQAANKQASTNIGRP